jgi:type III restriction enzyme
MPDSPIENPILNTPIDEPTRHWRFTDEGISNEWDEGRRRSAYFMPIAKSKRSDQMQFETEWTADRIEENRFINDVRDRVATWRRAGHPGVTETTHRLLAHWTREDREKKLFFCQMEAVETAIYLCEFVARQGHQDAWITAELRRQAEDANPGLYRMAFKMATGTGKTVVMAMLIAWQALNRFANARDPRFSDAFLIVTPGITIRDRLRVLLPSSPDNYYRQRDLLSGDDLSSLGKARIVITNFHGFLTRDRQPKVAKATKEVLNPDGANPFEETPQEMVKRVCRALGNRRGVIVMNDEAHHCYQHRIGGNVESFFPAAELKGDERKEAEQRDEDARVWARGLQAVNEKIGIRNVFDLSATPFFLAGSGYPEGTLFPWVVSDFALIDAIEAGLVKIPRVPVADDASAPGGPVYRNLWAHIRKELPKRGIKDETVIDRQRLPALLEGALRSLYENYATAFERWQEMAVRDSTPPVFIVVCGNTSISKLVFDFIAGYERELKSGGMVAVPGELELFSNVSNGRFLSSPNTILVDSAQLESGEAMSAEFKKTAALEIERFKAEYAQRFPGRDPEDLSDEELLREVMNTVGKPGRLGEHLRCVISVSMLTEGWDANTVTHILGVRAFTTQLLCEQVVGRGLRRRSYAVNPDTGHFEPEYAEIYGVPFSFIPASGSAGDFKPPTPVTRVKALEQRAALEIQFPKVRGYRFELSGTELSAKFTADSRLELSTQLIPTETEMLPVIGEADRHLLDDLRSHREQEVAYRLAKRVHERYWLDEPWTFPQLVKISRDWMTDCLILKDHTFVQMLLIADLADRAAERIRQAVVLADPGVSTLTPVIVPHDALGSTSAVDFDTTKATMRTREDKCQISHVVCDTDTWEQKVALALESMDEVLAYARNERLGFTIPYTVDGRSHEFVPDFLAKMSVGDEDMNLVIEVSGQDLESKRVKLAAARELWIPAINNSGEFGRWELLEIRDPWSAEATIRDALGQSIGMAA